MAPIVRTLADVNVEQVSWLWPGRLPAGKLVLIDGDPSAGKSTLTLDLAARVSTGSTWPDGARNDRPRGVLLLSAEDGLADTIAPRLTAAGADRSRVHALIDVPVIDGDDVRRVPPSLPRDIGHIERTIESHDVGLVVVDVLMAYLNGGVDSHRDQDVRGVLHLLAAMAERTGACIVLVRHLNKGGANSPLYRGGGSIGIIGAARAAYIVARDPEDPDRRVFAVSKLNIAAEPPALAYRLTSHGSLGCARIEWEDTPLDVTAAALLQIPTDDDGDDRDACTAWLTDYLMDNGGEASASDVFRTGRAVGGWSQDQLKRAKKRAGARSAKSGMSGGWVWRLDPRTHEGSTKGAKGAGTQPPPSSHSSPPPSPVCRCCGEALDPVLIDQGYTDHGDCTGHAARRP
nr:AAA family ATPase [Isoptericola sediminis]